MSADPQLIVYCGPMWSGKTSAMLALLDRYRYQNKSVVVFKPKIDDRYSRTEVTTHTGWKIPAVTIETAADILKYLNDLPSPPDVVAIDELFMVPGSAKIMIWLFRQRFTVVVSTLDLSSECKPFAEVKEILPWATKIEKLSAVCVVCGKDAKYTYRKSDNTDEIAVGGGESYEPRCAHCYPKFTSI